MSKISIVGVPMDLGADRRGVDMGPSALRYADLNEKLQALGYEVDDLGDLDVIIPETRHFGDPHAKYLKEIADACTHLANLVLEIHTDHRTPIVLGGDHSIAVGTMSGMAESFRRQNGKIGLMRLDAHADFLDPYESPGVATPVRGGADYREAHLAMEMVADTKKMVSFEIAEINPILDVHNKTAHFGMELILSAFGKQIL